MNNKSKNKTKAKKVDIKYLGIPNICFSLTDKDDKREKKFSKQRMKRGFDSSETWSLFSTIVKFILPRLKCYREHTGGYPACLKSVKEWEDILDQMIEAFELIYKDSQGIECEPDTEKQDKINENKIEKGLDLFRGYFFALWN